MRSQQEALMQSDEIRPCHDGTRRSKAAAHIRLRQKFDAKADGIRSLKRAHDGAIDMHLGLGQGHHVRVRCGIVERRRRPRTRLAWLGASDGRRPRAQSG